MRTQHYFNLAKNICFGAIQNAGKSNRVFQAWTEVCDKKNFDSWEVQIRLKSLKMYDMYEETCFSKKIGETLVWHNEPESKRQFIEWKHTNSSLMKKFREQQSVIFILIYFLDIKRPIFIDFLKKGKLWKLLPIGDPLDKIHHFGICFVIA